MPAKALSNAGILFTERRDFYIKPDVVAELWPSVTPFTSMLLAKGARKVKDPDFKLFEHRSTFLKQEFTVNDSDGATWSGTTGLPGQTATIDAINNLTGFGSLTSANEALIGLVCEVWDSTMTTFKGISHIQSVSGSSITIKSMGNPRVANNQHAAIANGDKFIVITNAFGEGTEAPEAFSDELEVVYNSAQIFKTVVEVTGTLYEAALRGYSNELARLRTEKQKEHKFQLEKAFLLGQRSKGTGMKALSGTDYSSVDAHAETITDSKGKTVRTTMGIIPAILKYGSTTGDYKNIFTINEASYTWKDYVEDTEKVFQFLPSTGRKVAYCGQGALSYWSKMSGSEGFVKKSGWSVQLSKSEMTGLGFAVRTLETPHGVIDLVYAPQLRGQYHKTMVILDESNVEICEYRPMKFMANIKTDNAYDGIKDQYFYDAGLGITLIESHSLWQIV